MSAKKDFKTEFWEDKIEQYKQFPDRFVKSDGQLYYLDQSDSMPKNGRGFYGQTFEFSLDEFASGRVSIISNNVWSNGTIPKELLSEFGPNYKRVRIED